MEPGFNTEALTIAITCFAIGVAIGIFISRRLANQASRKGNGLSSQRQDQRELAAYRHDVGEHFLKTATLLKNLGDDYGQLHQHLNDVATRLGTPEINHQLAAIESSPPKNRASDISSQADLKAPLDYAPGNGGLRGG